MVHAKHGLSSLRSPPPASDATLLPAPAPPNPAPHCPATASRQTSTNNALTGTLDAGLGRAWPLMEELMLDRNQLRGPIPPSFTAMGRLKRLLLL